MVCALGLIGTGNLKFDVLSGGNGEVVRFRKNVSICPKKSGVMAEITPSKIRNPPKATAVIMLSLPQKEFHDEPCFPAKLFLSTPKSLICLP